MRANECVDPIVRYTCADSWKCHLDSYLLTSSTHVALFATGLLAMLRLLFLACLCLVRCILLAYLLGEWPSM
jgi:hypothetical protein